VPNDADIAYAAGLFDGEGSISIVGSVTEAYRLLVRVDMTSIIVINWFYKTFGGSQYIRSRPKGTRVMFSWQLSGPKAKDFLTLIRSQLKLKNKEADVAIMFQEIKNHNKDRRRPRTQEEQAVESEIASLLRETRDSNYIKKFQ